MARGSVAHATHVGVSTWIGLIVGTMAKIALAVSMLGVFLMAYWW